MLVKQLGCVAFEQVWQAMRDFTNQRTATTSDELWLLEHPAIFTLGQAGKTEHILFSSDIPMIKTDRGGQVTYHGQGQLVGYCLFDVKRLGVGVRELVEIIEDSLVDALACYGITSYANRDAHGVYVGDKKIASLGLRIRKGCSYHGFAINVDMDLRPFQHINPCGYAGLQMTQMRDYLKSPPSLDNLGQTISQILDKKLYTS